MAVVVHGHPAHDAGLPSAFIQGEILRPEVCPLGGESLEAGVVQAFSAPVPGLLDIGRYPSGTDEFTARVAAAFRAASFDSVERGDVLRWKYRKLLTNLANAVEAVCHPSGRGAIIDLAREEGVACLEAAGIDFASAEEDRARIVEEAETAAARIT